MSFLCTFSKISKIDFSLVHFEGCLGHFRGWEYAHLAWNLISYKIHITICHINDFFNSDEVEQNPIFPKMEKTWVPPGKNFHFLDFQISMKKNPFSSLVSIFVKLRSFWGYFEIFKFSTPKKSKSIIWLLEWKKMAFAKSVIFMHVFENPKNRFLLVHFEGCLGHFRGWE